MIYINEIARIPLNSLTNTKDYKLLILRYITIIMIKLIVYKPLNISLSELFLIL